MTAAYVDPPTFRADERLRSRLIEALASREPYSLTFYLFLIGVVFLRVTLADAVWGAVSLSEAPRLAAAIAACDALILVCGRFTWNRWSHRTPTRVVSAALTLGALASVAAWAPATEAMTVTAYVTRFTIAVVVYTVILVILNERRRWRSVVRALLRDEQRLHAIREDRELALLSIREQVSTTTLAEIENDLYDCVAALEETTAHPSDPDLLHAAAHKLRSCATGVVRQLSHTLDAEPERRLPSKTETQLEPGSIGLRVREVVEYATTKKPFSPLLTTVFIAAASLGVGTSLRGRAGVATALVFSLVVFASLLIAHRLVTPTLSQVALPLRYVIIVGSFAGVSASAVAVTYLIRDPFLPIVRFWAAATTGLLMVSVVIAVTRAITATRNDYLRQLVATNSSLESEAQHLHEQEVAARRQVAHLLHGDIQSRLSAAAFQLDTIADRIDTPTQLGEDEERRRIEDCATAVTDSVVKLRAVGHVADDVPPEFRETVAALQTQWRGLLAIQLHVDSRSLTTIDSSPTLSSAIVDLIREAAANSARHGGAHELHVTIQVDADSVIVVIEDDGSGPHGTTDEGLGLRSISRRAMSVELRRHDSGGAQLVARFPVPGGARTGALPGSQSAN